MSISEDYEMLKKEEPTETFNYVIVIDESGSMCSLKKEVESSINGFIKSIKDSGLNKIKKVLFSLYKFGCKEGRVVNTYNKINIDDVPDEHNYLPFGNTPLYDGIGAALSDNSAVPNGVCHIITDGHENDSRIFTKQQIIDMIDDMKNNFNWAFQYTGCGPDAFSVGSSLGVKKEHIVDFSTGYDSISIGFNAGMSSQGSNAIALGLNHGISQSKCAIALGSNHGISQSKCAIALGSNHGMTSQGSNAIELGLGPDISQSKCAIALGSNHGISQSKCAIVLGSNHGISRQGEYSIALGSNHGFTSSGSKSIDLGFILDKNSTDPSPVVFGKNTGPYIDYSHTPSGDYSSLTKQSCQASSLTKQSCQASSLTKQSCQASPLTKQSCQASPLTKQSCQASPL
jgi:hypothetical protein